MAWFEGVELAEKDLPVLCGEKFMVSGENVAKTLRRLGGGI